MARDRLTPNQEEFVQNLIQGQSQREAYKKAFSCVNQKDSTIDAKASKLIKQPKIKQRFDELQELLRERQNVKAIMTAEERMEWLSKLITGEVQEEYISVETDDLTGLKIERVKTHPAKLDTKLKAIDILNKMSGEYTTKLQGELNIPKLEDLL